MSRAKSAFVAFCLVGLIGTAWAAQRSETPADALAPANDHVAQLERRVAELEARIEKLERLLPGPLPVPANWTAAPPMLTTPPAPLPIPDKQEANGVKFRFYLLGTETDQQSRPRPPLVLYPEPGDYPTTSGDFSRKSLPHSGGSLIR